MLREKRKPTRNCGLVIPIVFPKVESFGWRAKVQFRRGTTKITVKKEVREGAKLTKGYPLHCYLVKNLDEREMVLCYLDGERDSVLDNIGGYYWQSKLQQCGKRSAGFTIARPVAVGAGLGKRTQLYGYVARCNRKPGFVLYLDGKQRGETEWKKGDKDGE